jgi:hypothetical protein
LGKPTHQKDGDEADVECEPRQRERRALLDGGEDEQPVAELGPIQRISFVVTYDILMVAFWKSTIKIGAK